MPISRTTSSPVASGSHEQFVLLAGFIGQNVYLYCLGSARYTRAQEIQVMSMIDECLLIADDSSKDSFCRFCARS